MNSDKVINSKITVIDGTIKLNGHRLAVKGDLIITGNSNLIMLKEKDYLFVEGSFKTESIRPHWDSLKAGTLEVKGDFTQKSPDNTNPNRNFDTSGTHKVILSGEKVQKVSFSNPGNSGFVKLEINNTSEEGVIFSTPIYFRDIIDNAKHNEIIYNGYFELNSDKVINSKITVTDGTIKLNGHRLAVKGDLIITGNSNLIMLKEKDYLFVEGSFKTESIRPHWDSLKAGTLEVKGDFTQKSPDNTNPNRNFDTSGTHKVILSGEKVQKVSFSNPGNSMFNILIVTKHLDTGYDLTKAYYQKSVWTEDGYKNIWVPAWNYLAYFYGAKFEHHFGKSGTNPVTGNFSESFNDMTMKVPGFELEFTRTYNSLDDKSTLFGRGWTFGFEGSLKDYKDFEKIKKVTLPDGSTQLFTLKDDGTYEANDSRNELVKQSDGTHVLKTKNQYTYGFNENGWLVWMKDNIGDKVTIEVQNDTGKIQKIIDAAERGVNITYNDRGLIESIIDPIGRKVQYEYEQNKLLRVIDPMGSVTRYSYDSEGYLNEIKDNESNTIKSIEYDHAQGENQHKVKSTENALGNVETYTYDNANGKTIITDKNGRKTTKWYDSSKFITFSEDAEGRQTKVEYTKDKDGINKYGEQEKVTDRNGSITKYERDNKGNITKITNPDSTVKVQKYDDKNNLIMETDETGRSTHYIYDSEKVDLLKTVQALNPSNEYTKDSDENDFAITTYSYYSNGESGCNVKGLLKSETDPEGNTTTYTYDKYGNIATITDEEGNTTTREYNEIGMLTREVSSAGNISDYEYNLNGQITKGIFESNHITRNVYDTMGRKIKEIKPNQYDSSLEKGNSYTGDQGYRYTYYNNGNVKSITDPENNTTTFTYDIYGNKKSETKPNGAVYVYEYDVMNRPSKVYFKESDSSDSILLEEYTYDILSNGRTQKTHKVYSDDQKYSTTTYIFDYAQRLISQTNADNTTIETEYNENGTVKLQKDQKKKITYLKYDGLNRVSEKWIPFEEEGGTQKYTYTWYVYDKSGNIKEEKTGKNKVNKNEVPESFITVHYDHYNNGKVKAVYDDEGRRKEYTYDEDGNIIKEVVYTSETEKNIIEYRNNPLGKPREKIQYVEGRDIHGNPINDSEKVELITKFTYDKNGNMKTVTTPDGITTTYTYDNLDNQTSISHPGLNEYGEKVTISTENTYNWEGNILTNKDANGNITRYTYNKRGLVEKVKAPNNGVTIKYYDTKGRLIAKVTPKNYHPDKSLDEMNRSEYVYDSMDRIIVVNEVYLNPVTNKWETVVSKACKYDEKGNLIKELDSLGYEAGSGDTAVSKINRGYRTEYKYNSADKLISVLDPASRDKGLSYSIKYEYDALGRKIKEIDAKGAVNKYYLDSAGNITKVNLTETSGEEKILEENTYDLIGNILTHTDGNGNITEYWYNNINKVRKVKHPGDETIPEKIVQYQYDELGNLKYQQDSMGIEEIYSYDTVGNVLSTTLQRQDESEGITVKAAYDKNGNNRFQTDGNGNVTENIYDELNRLVAKKTTVTNTEGEKTDHITKYAYDLNGNLTEETDWRGNTYTNVYDPLNRLIEKKDSDGKTIERLEYNHNNAQIRSYDALGNESKFTYDKSNRLLSTTDPEENVITQTYDEVGNIRTKTDGEGNKTTFQYDEFNRLKTVTNALDETTSYTYDLNGNLLTQTDGEGNITSYEYNAANKAKEKTDQEGLSEQYTYYADGNIKTKRDRNGKLTTYTYDAYGNLKATVIEDKIISYTYDNNGNQLTMTDETGTTIRVYDELNRVASKTEPDIGTTTFQYDIIKGGDKEYWAEQSTDPKGNKTLKVYNKSGRLAKVIAENKTTEYTYYDNGARKTIEYPDGSKEEYTYYKNNLLKTLINKKVDGNIIDSYSYEYDKANNRIKKTDSKGTTEYTYDKLSRLKTVKENTSLAENRITGYTYYKAGNKKTETITYQGEITQTTYNYNKQNRLLNTVKTANSKKVEERIYTFDRNGNQLKETITLFENGIEKETKENKNTFDVLNRLIKTQTSEGNTVNNTYNGEGIRVSKEVDGKLRRYLYEYDKVVLELDEQGNTVGRNVYGLNLISREIEGQTAYYMYNGHADVTALINAEGEILSSYYYDAFGNILESIGNIDNPYRYAGYQYDEETGTYYCMARMYDPYIARFLSEDTYTGDVNDPLSLNLYTYCANNPITYYDPTGHFFDVIADVGFIIWDIVDIAKDPTDWKNWAALGADGVCAVVPFATGGGRAVKTVDKAVDVYQAVDKTYDTYKTVNKTKEFLKASKVVGRKVLKDAAIEGAIYSSTNAVHQVATTGEVDVKEVVNSGIEGAGRRALGDTAGLGIGKGLEVGTRKFINSSAGNKVINKVSDFVTGAKNYYDNVLYHAKNFIANENGHIKLPDGSDLKVRNVGAKNTGKSDNFITLNLQHHASKGAAKPDFIAAPGGVIYKADDYASMVVKEGEGINTLYHYTNDKGLNGILESGKLNPSIKALNPKDARYTNGQYLSDVVPGENTLGQLSYKFLRTPWGGKRFTNYLEIDVRGLNIIKGRDGVYAIPNEGPLDISNRIINYGKSTK